MAYDPKQGPDMLALKKVQQRETHVDYSYDQWRQAQMRQLEQNYAAMFGQGHESPA